MEATYVVIGGGIAGVSCAEGLAIMSPGEKIILVSASPLIKSVTNVVPLARTLTQFDVEEREASTLTASHPSVSVIIDSVTRVDLEKKIVATENGRSIGYQKLCICTGARPKLIEESNPFVIGIRDTESAEDLASRIKRARRVVVVGNGGIATEIVHEVRGVEMVWVVKDDHISATFVDPGAAEFFQRGLTEGSAHREPTRTSKRVRYTASTGAQGRGGAALGPDWHYSLDLRGAGVDSRANLSVEYRCEVANIARNESNTPKDPESWPVLVELTNGKSIDCDLVVSATGVTPSTELEGLENLQRAQDHGFKVDWQLRTSSEDVYAAGDVCSADWDLARHWFQMRLWTQALHTGRYAAKSMSCALRGEEFYQDFAFELFTHVTKFFGYKVVLLGLYNGQKLGKEYEILLRMTEGVEYVKLVMKDGRMHGAVLIGETDLEEMCENLILNQLDLTVYGEELLNPDIDIEDYFD